jgi:hypothetical protein
MMDSALYVYGSSIQQTATVEKFKFVVKAGCKVMGMTKPEHSLKECELMGRLRQALYLYVITLKRLQVWF